MTAPRRHNTRAGSIRGGGRGYVVEAGTAPRLDSLNLLLGVLARKEDTDGAFSLLEMAGARGAMAPPHSHGREDEAFYVLDGRMQVEVDDIEMQASVGDFVYIPRGSRHAFTVRSASAKFLCLIVPGGFEGYFRDLGRSTDAIFPREPSEFSLAPAEQRAAVGDRYHWTRET